MNIETKFNEPFTGWTYGCEHEFGDWDRTVHLPKGFGVDRKDYTVMNSNGIAADPKGVVYQYGGEINTPPTLTAAGQVRHLREIKALFPDATVNHRSNLHVHIRVPGLIDDLDALKQLAMFNHRYLPSVLEIIEPIPEPHRPVRGEHQCNWNWRHEQHEWQGAVRRCRRRRVSHHTVITPERMEKQWAATTVEKFFAAECPHSKEGLPLWHLAARHAVNLRHMREDIETIEFRHFPGTLDEQELLAAVEWCEEWLCMAICELDKNPIDLAHAYKDRLPKFPEYDHILESRYRQTCHDGTVAKGIIEENIQRILRDTP